MDGLLHGAPDAPTASFVRMSLIGSYPVGTAAVAGSLVASINLPDAIMAVPFVTARLAFFRYIKCKIELYITANGNKFLYGSLICSTQYTAGLTATGTGGTFNGVAYAAGAPHGILDVNSPDGLRLDMDWCYPYPAIDMLDTHATAVMGRLVIQVMAPITPVSTAATTGVVTVNVYGRLTDVVLDGPIGLSSAPVMGAPAPDVPQMRRARPVHGESTTEAERKSGLGLVLGVTSFIAKAAMSVAPMSITSALGWAGKLAGYDYPRDLRAPTVVRPKMWPNAALGEGLDSSSILSLYAGTKPVATPDVDVDGVDEMSIAGMGAVPSLLSSIDWAEADTPGTTLWTTPVNPHVMSPSNAVPPGPSPSWFMPTYLAAATTPFAYWRGSICYNVYLSCSTSHSGRLRFTFQPGDDGTEGATWDRKQAITAVYEVSGPCMIPFTVPFVYSRAWAIESIGMLYIAVESQLSPIGDVVTAPVTGYVYVSGAKDLQVASPNGCMLSMYSLNSYLPPEEPPARRAVRAGVGAGPDVPEFWPLQEMKTAVSEGNTSGYGSAVLARDGVYTADIVDNWMAVLRQPAPWLDSAQGGGASTWSGVASLDLYPRATARFHYANVGTQIWGRAPGGADYGHPQGANVNAEGYLVSPVTTPTGTVSTNVRLGLLDHVVQFYRYQRGSMRLKLLLADNTAAGVVSTGTVYAYTHTAGPVAGLPGFGDTFMPPFYTPVGSGTGAPFAVEASGRGGVMELEVPRTGNSLFALTGGTAGDTVTVSGVTQRLYTPDNMLTVRIQPMRSASILAAFRAAGDDYRVFGLQLPYNVQVVRTIISSEATASTYIATTACMLAQWAGIYFT